jgi:hypothetical protein
MDVLQRYCRIIHWSAKNKMPSKPRRLALVKFTPPESPVVKGGWARRYPFKKKEAYVFLGEIPNMPGHCVVAERMNGKIHAGFHTELFSELATDEV